MTKTLNVNSMYTKYLPFIVALWWFVPLVNAQDEGAKLPEQQLVTIDELSFSMSIGIGEKTNPLVGGDDIPLYLVPSLSYYGEQFFFDNGDLGYSFYDKDNVVVSLLTRINPENAHFSRWHPANIAVLDSFVENGIATDLPQDTRLDIDDIEKRRWALDAGIQLNWFIDHSWAVTTQLLHDVNNVYNGLNGKFELQYQPNLAWSDRVAVQSSIGIHWFSRDMANYYYGIDQRDTSNINALYQTSSAINPYAKLLVSYQLNRDWRLFLSINYTSLDNTIYRSPIVEEKNITTSFIGVRYVF